MKANTRLVEGFILVDSKGVAGVYLSANTAIKDMEEGDLCLPASIIVDGDEIVTWSDESPALLN